MSQALLSPTRPQSRHRAHSTNMRPALTLNTLERRRSNSMGERPDAVNSPVVPSPSETIVSSPVDSKQTVIVSASDPPPSPSMFALLASRMLELLHVSSKQSQWSTPSSRRSSMDEYVLPISASSQQTTFGDVFGEKEMAKAHASNAWWSGHPPIKGPMLLVMALLPLSTALVLFCLSTLPITVSWPRTLTDMAILGRELHGYSQSGFIPMAHVLGVLSITAVWKHAWSIPGSVIWNVLAGALFSPALATLLLTALTTIGSTFATLLAKPLAPFLAHFFPRALDYTRTALEGDSGPGLSTHPNSKSSTWVRLSVLRLIGVVPWSGINLASGVCGVAIKDCVLGAFIGSLPWTAVTCQIGDILQTVASTPSPTPQTVSSVLASPEIIFKLVFLSFLSLAPILLKERLRALISSSPDMTQEERMARWTWVHDWRSKIHLSSRSRSREASHKQLDILIQEKEAMQP